MEVGQTSNMEIGETSNNPIIVDDIDENSVLIYDSNKGLYWDPPSDREIPYCYWNKMANWGNNREVPYWRLMNGNKMIYLNNLDYFNHLLDKSKELFDNCKNIKNTHKGHWIKPLRLHMFDLEELLEIDFFKNYEKTIKSEISSIRRIINIIKSTCPVFNDLNERNRGLFPD